MSRGIVNNSLYWLSEYRLNVILNEWVLIIQTVLTI